MSSKGKISIASSVKINPARKIGEIIIVISGFIGVDSPDTAEGYVAPTITNTNTEIGTYELTPETPFAGKIKITMSTALDGQTVFEGDYTCGKDVNCGFTVAFGSSNKSFAPKTFLCILYVLGLFFMTKTEFSFVGTSSENKFFSNGIANDK